VWFARPASIGAAGAQALVVGSGQGSPSGLVEGMPQAPLGEKQIPATWQLLGTGQTFGGPLVHTPAWQVSGSVHASRSLQSAPSAWIVSTQAPVATSHAATAQVLAVEQTTGEPPTQAPASQASTCVQASPSSQGEPPGASASTHCPVAGSQNAT